MGCISSTSKEKPISQETFTAIDRDLLQEPQLVQGINRVHTDSTRSSLEDRDISQVTDIVSAKNRHRFAVEYLEIDPNEYHTIEAEAQFIHHDTLFECIRRWKNRTEAEGNNAKDELIRILTQIRRDHGWFPGDQMWFLTDVKGLQIPEPSKYSNSFKAIHNYTTLYQRNYCIHVDVEFPHRMTCVGNST